MLVKLTPALLLSEAHQFFVVIRPTNKFAFEERDVEDGGVVVDKLRFKEGKFYMVGTD